MKVCLICKKRTDTAKNEMEYRKYAAKYLFLPERTNK